MKKNDVLTIRIEDMGVDGEGIGKVDNIPLFVKDALIGDVVSVKIMKMKKNYGYARLLEILEPSNHRASFTAPAVAARFRRFPMKNSWNSNNGRSEII